MDDRVSPLQAEMMAQTRPGPATVSPVQAQMMKAMQNQQNQQGQPRISPLQQQMVQQMMAELLRRQGQ